MTSLLVLLALLSVATLAARRGTLGEIIGGAATPILVIFGIAVSPAGLGFLTPSVLEGLGPALAVAVCWLGLIAGLRAGAPIAHEVPDRRALLPFLDAALAAAVILLVSRTALAEPFGVKLSGAELVVAALLAGACLGAPASTGSEARFAKIAALLVAAAAVGIASPTNLGVVAGLGAIGAVVVLLVGGRAKGATLIALLGTITIVAGTSQSVGAPGVLAGVATGVFLARAAAGRVLWPLAERSERPVRIVVAVLVAASAPVDGKALLLGAVLASLALAATALVRGLAPAARSGALATSSLALALVASLAAAGAAPTLLAPLLIAVAAVDAVALAARVLIGAQARSAA